MAREASIELNCICEQKEIMYLLDLLCNGGWTVYNKNKKIEYLPVGDDDDFGWKEDNITYEELRKIVEMKQQRNELVGVVLFYEGTSHGIDVLLRDLQNVIISIDINRNTIGDERDSLTNFAWYFSKIIMLLDKEESLWVSYKFEDYMD